MPLGPWELMIICCMGLPLVAAVVLVFYLVRRNQTGAATAPPAASTGPVASAPVISCPKCGSSVAPEDRFCPSCGEPRTSVREELQRTADATGVPYEELLQRARERNRRPPDSTF